MPPALIAVLSRAAQGGGPRPRLGGGFRFLVRAPRPSWAAYAAKLAYLRVHRGRSLGLGAAVAALLLVPGVN
jgi:hypothetical protein